MLAMILKQTENQKNKQKMDQSLHSLSTEIFSLTDSKCALYTFIINLICGSLLLKIDFRGV